MEVMTADVDDMLGPKPRPQKLPSCGLEPGVKVSFSPKEITLLQSGDLMRRSPNLSSFCWAKNLMLVLKGTEEAESTGFGLYFPVYQGESKWKQETALDPLTTVMLLIFFLTPVGMDYLLSFLSNVHGQYTTNGHPSIPLLPYTITDQQEPQQAQPAEEADKIRNFFYNRKLSPPLLLVVEKPNNSLRWAFYYVGSERERVCS